MIGQMEKKPQQSESRDADKYILRMPPGMRDRIAALAQQNKRSMNAEIIDRLELTFQLQDTAQPAGNELIVEITKAVDQLQTLVETLRINEIKSKRQLD